jgi:hypothetical protein
MIKVGELKWKKSSKLNELATDGSYYTQEEIKIVKYAEKRGF